MPGKWHRSTASRLRLYEARGLLQPVTIQGVKYYTPRDRLRVEIVLKGKRLGFSLGEIERLVLEPVPPPRAAPVEMRTLDLDRVVEELRALLSERDNLDVSIEELKALLAGR